MVNLMQGVLCAAANSIPAMARAIVRIFITPPCERSVVRTPALYLFWRQ